MHLSKFAEKAQEVLQEAQNIATRNHHQAVDVEHLAPALLQQENGLIPRLLEMNNLPVDQLRARLEEELARVPQVTGDTSATPGLYVTNRLKQLLE